MAQTARTITLKTAAGVKTRTEQYLGREHIVVPVVALVEGVVRAMNSQAPELVLAEEFSRSPIGWNGRPVFLNHPLKNGRPVSGNSPEVLASKIGTVFNTSVKNSKLMMEAWIDVAAAKRHAPTLLQRVQDGEPIEISVGCFVAMDDKAGEYNGAKYSGAWKDIVPDHLAILEDGVLGACSREMGCGVRAAQEHKSMSEKRTVLNRFMSALGLFRASQPASEMSSTDLSRRLYDALKEIEPTINYVEAFIPVDAPNRVVYSCAVQSSAFGVEAGMGYQYMLYERSFSIGDNGSITLNTARVEVEPIVSYEPILMGEDVTVAEAGELIAAAGKRNSSKDQQKIQAMHDHSRALGAYCDPKAMTEPKNAGAGAPCSCGGGNHAPTTLEQGEADMTKEQLEAFLKTATTEQLKAMSAVIEKPEPNAAELKAAADAEAERIRVAAEALARQDVATQVAAAIKSLTFEQILATADPAIRDAVATGKSVGEAKKASTVKALKDTGRCSYSDSELAAMNQGDLDRLVSLAGNTVRAAIDFSGQGTPKAEADKQTVPSAPDLGAAIRANQAKNKK